MEIFLDPTVWAGLATLVALEIVLGIDNLIFIAILSDKLPPEQRQRARFIGLSLALIMRLVLLAAISWMTKLTEPLFYALGSEISGRDLIMFVGGAFLLFKGTMELHEKLEGAHLKKTGPMHYASFWPVIIQIVVLDAVFSLDAVITAVGMSDHLIVMMLAVCIAIGIMILASNKLMDFVSTRPTVVILCLGFLLMIGFSLIVEGLDYHIPKGYLYAAIGFSVLIEACNQVARNNKVKNYEKIDPRIRLSQAVFSLLGSKTGNQDIQSDISVFRSKKQDLDVFGPQEKLMIHRVLNLAEHSVKSAMTPRNSLYWIDLDDDIEMIEKEIKECPYSCMVVTEDGQLDKPLGILLKKDIADLLIDSKDATQESLKAIIREPIFVPEFMTVLQALDVFQSKKSHIAFVIDEYGSLEGLITLTDIVETIAGDLPEEHEEDNFKYEVRPDGGYLMNGSLTIQELKEVVGEISLPEGSYSTVAGIALHVLKRVPQTNDIFALDNWNVTIKKMDRNRISRIKFTKRDKDTQV